VIFLAIFYVRGRKMERQMNSDTHEMLRQIAKDVDAIVPCEICGNNYIRADSQEADRLAYASATTAWKREAFRGDRRQDIMSAMKGVLDGADWKCPSCR
jgi:hypothetical protein